MWALDVHAAIYVLYKTSGHFEQNASMCTCMIKRTLAGAQNRAIQYGLPNRHNSTMPPTRLFMGLVVLAGPARHPFGAAQNDKYGLSQDMLSMKAVATT